LDRKTEPKTISISRGGLQAGLRHLHECKYP